jgi:hypothetical protein
MEKAQNSDDPRPPNRWQLISMHPLLLVIATIIGAIIAAAPSLISSIKDYKEYKELNLEKLGVPFDPLAISIAKQQLTLWQKNFDCSRDIQSTKVTTPTNDTVKVGICPTTGDVLITLVKVSNLLKPRLTWITPEALPPLASLSIPNLQNAFAEERHLRSQILVQNGPTVICQKWNSNGFIIRVTQFPNGQCIEETINPSTGVIVSSKTVSCYRC